MVYTPKTKVSDTDVKAFLETIDDEQKKSEAFELLDMFVKVS